MEAFRPIFGLSTWILRVAILVMVYMIFFVSLRSPDFKSIEFFTAAGFALFAALLFIGGFMKKSSLTVVSSVILSLGCLYRIIAHYAFSQGNQVAICGVFFAIALFFVANGNKKK
jgi:hypothetical protein